MSLAETRDATLLESFFTSDPGAYAYHLGHRYTRVG
jgi:hypothetical protein